MVSSSHVTYAQVDPSSALLLRSSGKAPTKKDLDSSRYQVRELPQQNVDERRLQSSPTQVPTMPKQEVSPLLPTVNATSPKDVPISDAAKDVKTSPPNNENQSLIPPVQDMILGGSLDNISQYRRELDRDDYRRNIIDLNLVPMYIYNNSSSNFWYRNYFTSSPGVHLGADIWITPFFGFHTSYQTSLNASIKKETTSSAALPAQHEWFDAGLRFRKFFGNSKQAAGIIFSVDFSEYQFKIEKSAQNRIGTKSSGAKIGIETILPKNDVYQWNLGFVIVPRVDHKQVDTVLDIESGSSQESTRLGVSVGGRFVFSRKSQVFWKLSHEVEKNLFEGQSSVNDPKTGAPIDGVDVTNSFTILSLGYTWGN
ncbi:MAG: hypothetical protein KDD34_09035 [Bdellovibrionales bacterium]|nr:hypothetical protein [Bdellovibrionales bacterium]